MAFALDPFWVRLEAHPRLSSFPGMPVRGCQVWHEPRKNALWGAKVAFHANRRSPPITLKTKGGRDAGRARRRPGDAGEELDLPSGTPGYILWAQGPAGGYPFETKGIPFPKAEETFPALKAR